MRIYLIFVFTAVICVADWSSEDSTKLSDIYNVLTGSYAEQYKFQNGYYSNEAAGYALGWKDFFMESYKAQRELVDGTEYKFRKVDGRDTIQLVDQHPFSDNNETFFDLSGYAKSNEDYYSDNILSYFNSGFVPLYNQERPDSVFIDKPENGDIFNKMSAKMWREGFGIDAIKNSEQTAEIRGEVSNVETKVKNMISNNYTSSTLNYDFSEMGNFFVRNNTMRINPWSDLKGQLRIKPNETDIHYEIWHRYFDRSSSTYAIVLKWCLHTIMFLAFTIYVINDLMSIVDA